jgi:hypothetical protein
MAERIALGSEPRERLVVEASEPVIEKRGLAIGQDGVDELIVRNRTRK